MFEIPLILYLSWFKVDCSCTCTSKHNNVCFSVASFVHSVCQSLRINRHAKSRLVSSNGRPTFTRNICNRIVVGSSIWLCYECFDYVASMHVYVSSQVILVVESTHFHSPNKSQYGSLFQTWWVTSKFYLSLPKEGTLRIKIQRCHIHVFKMIPEIVTTLYWPWEHSFYLLKLSTGNVSWLRTQKAICVRWTIFECHLFESQKEVQ